MARFSDGGQVSNSAITFDTGATGTKAFRGFTVAKSSQDLLVGRYDSAGVAVPTYDMAILSNGKVGIGTMNPCGNPFAPLNCKLSVAGAIQAKDVVVNTNWSDDVFESSYRLLPLTEVATYIQAHHHLPDIPSGTEVKEKGVNLGEMQSKLLAKVEELTLHMIQADERNKRLEQQNRELQERIARLEAAENRSTSPAK
jgi:hypothetical protein